MSAPSFSLSLLLTHNLNSKIYNISSRKFKSVLHPSDDPNNQSNRRRPSVRQSPTHSRNAAALRDCRHPSPKSRILLLLVRHLCRRASAARSFHIQQHNTPPESRIGRSLVRPRCRSSSNASLSSVPSSMPSPSC